MALLTPYFIPSAGFYIIDRLAASPHPTSHPRATLDLIEATIDPNELQFGDRDLRTIIDRVRASDARIADSVAFRNWNDRLRVQNV